MCVCVCTRICIRAQIRTRGYIQSEYTQYDPPSRKKMKKRRKKMFSGPKDNIQSNSLKYLSRSTEHDERGKGRTWGGRRGPAGFRPGRSRALFPRCSIMQSAHAIARNHRIEAGQLHPGMKRIKRHSPGRITVDPAARNPLNTAERVGHVTTHTRPS